MDDHGVVEIQLGRPPRSSIDAPTRCHLGLPVVITVPPLLDDGTPFPTRYWLTCPLAQRRVSRVESAGGVADAEALVGAGDEIGERHGRAMARYAAERDAALPDGWEGPRPSGGVGGSSGGVKCLHAHYADYAAGNDNPIGEWVSASVEPLDCAVPCVIAGGGAAVPNLDWREPR